ncbi:MAG: hypothetical protein KDK44_00660, partial [Chlamydiia bacterium]|nr:hypothetical protein [Chlamydiia bacterium]
SFTAQNSVFNSGLDLKIHDEATMTAQMIHCRAKGSACFECFDQASCDVRLSQNTLENFSLKLNTDAPRAQLVVFGNTFDIASIETNTQLVYDWKNNSVDPQIVELGKGRATHVAP